ncbi:MAG: GPW/gp25 family protein [Deltaproteobacteria bacterium]|nr:GPW/gp25 family protein [Deltaproteobacteria bacterium]
MHIILNTQPGERPMLPEFGCALQDLVFKTNSQRTRHEAEMMVREALSRWEPRVDVQKVEARPSKDNPNQISLHIDYVVRKSNNHQNLVQLLHLQEFFDAD